MRITVTLSFVAAMLLIAAFAFAQDEIAPLVAAQPTSQPAARPDPQPVTQIQKWFDELADADPEVRDAAKVGLMGLPREQLDLLRQLAEKNRPLAPSQAAVLRDIVYHVFLAGEPYEQNARGFLGIHHNDFHQRPLPADEVQNDDATAQAAGDCVIVTGRVPGFCGFRYLQDGDLVLGVIGQDFQPTRSMKELRDTIVAIPPGDTITLHVQRNGKAMRLTFKLSAQPHGADETPVMDEFIGMRQQRAGEYWEKAFAPLVAGRYS